MKIWKQNKTSAYLLISTLISITVCETEQVVWHNASLH